MFELFLICCRALKTMTFDTHLSMTTHKMGEYWFSEEVKFQWLRNTSGIAVKLSKWTRDVGVVTRT